jgi:putative ABC transport system permease protein
MLRRGGAPMGAAILMLSLAVGATTAIFSLVHGVLLQPLPFSDPERLAMLWGRDPSRGVPVVEVSLRDLRAWRRNTTFESIDVFGSVNWRYRITAPGEPFTVSYSSVSSAFFDTLGVRPLLGRSFTAADDTPGAPGTVILSEDLWRRRFSADPEVVGKTITVGEGAAARPFEIIGVTDRSFQFPAGAELWASASRDIAAFAAGSTDGTDWDGLRVFYAVGRLKPGAGIDQARAELSTIARRLESRGGRTDEAMEVAITPLTAHFFGSARPALVATFGAVGVLLLIACANAAGLLLVHGVAREREIAVRLAIGATRSEIVRQFLWEAVALAGAAGILGISLAYVLVDVAVAVVPADVPRLDQVSVNVPVLLFSIALSLVIPVLVGVLPAWQLSRANVVDGLKHSARTGTAAPGASRVRKLLVAGELAAAAVLLVAAGLLARSFIGLLRIDPGFDPRNVLTFDLHVPESRYPTIEAERELTSRVLDAVRQTAGVIAAGAVYQRPFEHGPIGMDSGFLLEGQPRSPDTWRRNPLLNWEAVTPGYFKAMDVRLMRGRLFTDRDDERGPPVVIVSEAMAARVWPGQDPIGKRLRAYGAPQGGDPAWQTVVGVVEDVRYREMQEARLDLYLPFRQSPSPVRHVVVKTSGDPLRSAAAVRAALQRIDAQLAAEKVTTMERIVGATLAPWRFNMMAFAAFSGIALAFAAIGLSAVVAYAAQQRTREVGIRVALGARWIDIVRLLLVEGVQLTFAGLAIGLAGAWVLTRLLSSLLFGVGPTDATTFAVIGVLLALVALCAAYLPARRAARIDPVVALRVE